MAASQMYSSTPQPINTSVKSMASTGQTINVFFNSSKDTVYKKIAGYKTPEQYLGKVIQDPILIGREYKIRFEKDTFTEPYMWFNDRIVETEIPNFQKKSSLSAVNKPTLNIRALNKPKSNTGALGASINKPTLNVRAANKPKSHIDAENKSKSNIGAAASQMYSSTPQPMNTSVKSMASTRQALTDFFNSEKDTVYKVLASYNTPEKYLGKVIENPIKIGQEWKIRFENDVLYKHYMWFNDQIVETKNPNPNPQPKTKSNNTKLGGKSKFKKRKSVRRKSIRRKRLNKTHHARRY
jgi:hypothetical protein